MTEETRARYCCTTGGAVIFWFGIFAIGYGVVLLLQQGIPALGPYQPALLFAVAGVACIANFKRNRTFHCAITGPFFLLVAGAVALATAGLWTVSMSIVWAITLIVIGAALLLEHRVAA